MELLEYYYLIRQRVWIVILGISTALAIVLVYQVLPPSSREATGRLQYRPEAGRVLSYIAGDLGVGRVESFDRYLETLLESRDTLLTAADRTGLIGPELRERLTPIEARQPSPAPLMDVTGKAPTDEQARALTTSALEYISEYWNRDRVRRAQEIRQTIQELRQNETARLREAREAVEELRTGGLSPVQELARAEGDLAVTRSQIETTQQALAVAQDRLRMTEEIVAAEAARPPEQRTFTAATGDPLRAQVLNLRVQLAGELARRTPDHPEIKALEARIEQLEKARGTTEETEGEAPSTPPVLSREVLDARLAVDEARTRLAQLEAHADELRVKLPALRKQADEFADEELELRRVENSVRTMDADLDTIADEIERLTQQLAYNPYSDPQGTASEGTRDIVIKGVNAEQAVRVLPSPKTWPRFFLLVAVAILGGGILSSLVVLGLHYTSVVFTNEVEARAMLRTRILGAVPRSDLPSHEAGPPLRVR